MDRMSRPFRPSFLLRMAHTGLEVHLRLAASSCACIPPVVAFFATPGALFVGTLPLEMALFAALLAGLIVDGSLAAAVACSMPGPTALVAGLPVAVERTLRD